MFAVLSLLLILAFSILVTRIATVALTLTGLSTESARFQARSAFTGVGSTTSEAEQVVNHPVRRRVLMLLMLIGNAGIVTVISSLILAFVQGSGDAVTGKMVLLVGGVIALWGLASSKWVNQRVSPVINWLLRRWTDVDLHDYAGLLQLGGDYRILELLVKEDGWFANRTLADLKLREEGALVLGLQRSGGDYVGAPLADTVLKAGDNLIVYGRGERLAELDQRRANVGGKLEHADAVAEHERLRRDEQHALSTEIPHSAA